MKHQLDTSFITDNSVFSKEKFGKITIVKEVSQQDEEYYYICFENIYRANAFSNKISTFKLNISTSIIEKDGLTGVLFTKDEVAKLRDKLMAKAVTFIGEETEEEAEEEISVEEFEDFIDSAESIVKTMDGNKQKYKYVYEPKANADMAKLLQQLGGTDYTEINENDTLYELISYEQSRQVNYGTATINIRSLKYDADNVEIYYDANKVSAKEAVDIMKLRRKDANITSINKAESSEEYLKRLESLAPYVVMRGRITQYLDAKANTIPPLQLVAYYNTFPKLGLDYHSKTAIYDYHYFCTGPYQEGGASLRNDRQQELKEKFKSSLRLLVHIAHSNAEAIDILTPKACFKGLNLAGKQKAQQLFKEAIVEVAQEPGRENCKGIFVHFNINNKHSSLKTPMYYNPGDSLSPQQAANDSDTNINVAVLVMGGGAIQALSGNKGEIKEKDFSQSAEKRLTRMTLGATIIFCPGFNNKLIHQDNYTSISILASQKPDNIFVSCTTAISNFIGIKSSVQQVLEPANTNQQRLLQEMNSTTTSSRMASTSLGTNEGYRAHFPEVVQAIVKVVSAVWEYILNALKAVKELAFGREY